MRVRDLTAGERLAIARRRAGESKREAADRHGVTLYRYRAWEDDREGSGAPRVALGSLEAHEVLVIRRTRQGLSAQDLAAEMGISRWWLCKMEYGQAPIDALEAHWSSVPPVE